MPAQVVCVTCEEVEGDDPQDVCSKSKRECKHHCNCIWTQDMCHWCGAQINDDGEVVASKPKGPQTNIEFFQLIIDDTNVGRR